MKSAVFTGGRPVPCLEYNPVSLSVGEKLVPTQLQVLLIDSNELYLMDPPVHLPGDVVPGIL